MAPLLQKFCALVTVLAIALSLTAVANAWAMSGDMGSPAGMSDVSHQACDGANCPVHKMTQAPCYAACSATLAMLSTSLGTDLWTDQKHYPLAVATRIGQTSPPDPSPPRSFILN